MSLLKALDLMEILAQYTLSRFQWYLAKGKLPGPPPPMDMLISLIIECEILAMQASTAYRNLGAIQPSFVSPFSALIHF